MNNNGRIPAKSTYKNWRKHETNSKKKEISTLFPVNVAKDGLAGMSLEFQNSSGERITFYLCEHDKQLMLMNIDRFIHGKEVTREMYNLDELENLMKLQ